MRRLTGEALVLSAVARAWHEARPSARGAGEYPVPEGDGGEPSSDGAADDRVVPLRPSSEYGELAPPYTTTVIGSPRLQRGSVPRSRAAAPK